MTTAFNPVRCLLAAVALTVAGSACSEASPWYVGAALGLNHASNVYRLSDGAALPAGLSRGDTVATGALVAGLDQPFGRQRLSGNVELRSNRYANNGALNNTGHGLNLGLDWSTIERLSGRLSLQESRDLAVFNPDTGLPTLLNKNLARSRQAESITRLGLVSRWQAEATLGYRSVDYSAEEYRSRQYHQAWGSMGVRYRPSGALALGAALRATEGKFPQYLRLASGADLADQFRRRDLDLSADWTASGASTVSARLSTGHMRYTEATQRDFSGLTGELRWAWRPTGKLALNATLLHDTGQEANLGTGLAFIGTDASRTISALRLRADYELSAKISLNLGAGFDHRALVDTASSIGGALALVTEGSDRDTGLSIGARWTPSRNVELGCNWTRDQRSSDGRLSRPFGATTMGCVGKMVLQ